MRNIVAPSFLLLFILFRSTLYAQNLKEGLVEYGSNLGANTLRKSKIWFKDSCIIYEVRLEYGTSESTTEGTITKRSYPVGSFIYCDLRTMRAQNYFQFKDSARPICNFIAKRDGSLGWSFYKSKNNEVQVNLATLMPDTLIKNTLVKRIKIPYRDVFLIYYLKNDTRNSIFHLSIDEIIPSYKTFRMETVDTFNRTITIFEYEFLRDSLNQAEKNIFKQWGDNAKNTQLPLIPFDEAIKHFFDEVKHENPTIEIVPNNRN